MSKVDDAPSEAPGAPSLALLALEMRAWPELGLYFASWPLLLAQRRGDGHSVLVLPPFGTTDAYTSPLRIALRVLGYSTHGWGLGQNLGPTSAILEGVPPRSQELADRSGRPVSVIGWSAGGILGREAARRNPDAVRQVITLGSPFRLLLDDRYRTHAAFFYRLAERWHAPPTDVDPGERRTTRRCSTSPPPRSTAAPTASRAGNGASRTKGRARRTSRCTGATADSGTTRPRLVAIADRLAQPEGEWTPFTPPRALRHLYPQH